MALAPTAENLQREARIVELRAEGVPFRQIALEVGYTNPGDAHRLYRRAMRRGLVPERVGDERARQLGELDEIAAELWDISRRRHFVTTQGGRIVKGPDGEPLDDDGPKMAALNGLLRVLERRARLLGLDAPAKRVLNVVTHDALAAAMVEMEAEMAELDRAATEHDGAIDAVATDREAIDA